MIVRIVVAGIGDQRGSCERIVGSSMNNLAFARSALILIFAPNPLNCDIGSSSRWTCDQLQSLALVVKGKGIPLWTRYWRGNVTIVDSSNLHTSQQG